MLKRQIAAACLCIGSLAAFPASANAGEYYRDGYSDSHYHSGRGHGSSVWYSSTCCYRRVTRHESHYVRIDPYWRRHSYYQHGRYGDELGYRYPRYSDYNRTRSYYPASVEYDAYDAAAVDSCVVRRVRVADGRGGWVWGTASRCY